MIIQCDNCQARFDVPLDQVQAAHGRVACQRCGNVIQAAANMGADSGGAFSQAALGTPGALPGFESTSFPGQEEGGLSSLVSSMHNAEVETSEAFPVPPGNEPANPFALPDPEPGLSGITSNRLAPSSGANGVAQPQEVPGLQVGASFDTSFPPAASAVVPQVAPSGLDTGSGPSFAASQSFPSVSSSQSFNRLPQVEVPPSEPGIDPFSDFPLDQLEEERFEPEEKTGAHVLDFSGFQDSHLSSTTRVREDQDSLLYEESEGTGPRAVISSDTRRWPTFVGLAAGLLMALLVPGFQEAIQVGLHTVGLVKVLPRLSLLAEDITTLELERVGVTTYVTKKGDKLLVVSGSVFNAGVDSQVGVKAVVLAHRGTKVVARREAGLGVNLEAADLFGLDSPDELASLYAEQSVENDVLPGGQSQSFMVVFDAPPKNFRDLDFSVQFVKSTL